MVKIVLALLLSLAISVVSQCMGVPSTGLKRKLEREFYRPIRQRIFSPTGQKLSFSTAMVLSIRETPKFHTAIKTPNSTSEAVLTLDRTSNTFITNTISAMQNESSYQVLLQEESLHISGQNI